MTYQLRNPLNGPLNPNPTTSSSCMASRPLSPKHVYYNVKTVCSSSLAPNLDIFLELRSWYLWISNSCRMDVHISCLQHNSSRGANLGVCKGRQHQRCAKAADWSLAIQTTIRYDPARFQLWGSSVRWQFAQSHIEWNRYHPAVEQASPYSLDSTFEELATTRPRDLNMAPFSFQPPPHSISEELPAVLSPLLLLYINRRPYLHHELRRQAANMGLQRETRFLAVCLQSPSLRRSTEAAI
jgi:hypothetical protein